MPFAMRNASGSAVLDQLECSDRKLIELRYVEQLSLAEIADRLGIGLSAVKMRHLRLKRFRGLIQEPRGVVLVSEPDLDNLASITDEAGHSLTDVDDTQLDLELRDLLPVMEMLDRVGPRGGRAPSRQDGPSLEPEATGLLGDFLIVRVIGRGGMGVVYEAVQKSLNRRVALKVLPSFSAEDPRRVKQFQVEAEAAACLRHPHIVPVYLIGSENGQHYYAMQFIEGEPSPRSSARHARQRGRSVGLCVSSPRMAAELGRQAAEPPLRSRARDHPPRRQALQPADRRVWGNFGSAISGLPGSPGKWI